MKTCIWCRRTEPFVTFLKLAHTFPASLGGSTICKNVCDDCNHYFGSPTAGLPSVEIVLKEVLNLSRHLILLYGNNKKVGRFKSQFFKLDKVNRSLKVKPIFDPKRPYFQERLGRQFRRGMFKVFLEEREVYKNDAMDDRFDFIRRFARYNLDDYPIYYMPPKMPIIFVSETDTVCPTLKFTDHSDEEDAKYRMYVYNIMCHTFAIPTSDLFKIQLSKFKQYLIDSNHAFGTTLIEIKKPTDVDFTFSFMNESQ